MKKLNSNFGFRPQLRQLPSPIKIVGATIFSVFCLLCFSFPFSVVAAPNNYINVVTSNSTPRLALTLDACGGQTDMRILYLLKDKGVPATIFATSKWLAKNPEAISFIKSNPQLFRVENHGANHLSAIQEPIGPYHLPSAHTLKGLEKEVLVADSDIFRHFGSHPSWYRTAGALYDNASLSWLNSHNWKIAGYTVSLDEGATASKTKMLQNIQAIKPGGVILMHMNKPQSASFEGLKLSLDYLQSKGYSFGFLD